MQAVRFERCGEPDDVLQVVDVPEPEPGPGQVRVRMLASPINPSDLMFIRGTYGQQPRFPATPGFEGVGVVEAAGSGWLGRLMSGRRVAVLGGGNWAEKTVLSARRAVPLPADLSIEQCATFFVNPATAYVLTRKVLNVPRGGWLLQSAAGSALGRMIIRLGREYGFHTINVIRRPEQIAELKALGADEVLTCDGSEESTATLVERVRDTTGGVRSAIDPVGGAIAAAFVRCLGEGGRLILYGTLSGEPVTLSPRTLMASGGSVEGFWLGPWMQRQSLPSRLRLVRRLRDLIRRGLLTTEIATTYPLQEVTAAVHAAERPGKVLLRMGDQE